MSSLGLVEDTLFIPLAGRIHVSECLPWILYDEKALELRAKLPAGLLEQVGRRQYALVASAVRSANMDRLVREFLERRPDGVVVQLGCGLETAYYRCDNGRTLWYALDLPPVAEYRQRLLGRPRREICLAGDAFAPDWLREIRADRPAAPLLVIAGGLFHYFAEDQVLGLLRRLRQAGGIEIAFDAVSKSGMAMLQRKYMKQMGHGGARMFFYLDSSADLAGKLGGPVRLLAQEPYYHHIPRTGLKLSTRLSMSVSDALGMVKMLHLAF